MGFKSSRVVLVLVFFHLLSGLASGNVVLIGKNITRSFHDIEATFTPTLKSSGINGALYLAEPLDACSPLRNAPVEGTQLPFVLIIRSECTFEDEIRNAQDAGFKAAVVYDDKDSGMLVAMAGSSWGVGIYAVFISKASGEVLKEFAGRDDMELWIIPSYRSSAWAIMALSLISLLTVSAIMATCFFFRRQRIRRERPSIFYVRDIRGISSQLVKAMPTLIFTSVTDDNCTSASCAICLEDYSVGDKLRVLPCSHKFHTSCVDSWLTTWRSFCPVCKRDATTTLGPPPVSEHTPLLSCPSPISRQLSFSSSREASTPIDIRNLSRTPSVNLPRTASINLSRSPSINLSHSLSSSWSQISSNTTNMHSSCRQFTNFHPISRTRSDLRTTSSPIFRISDLTTAIPPGFTLALPVNSRYLHHYIPRPSSNSSPSNPIWSSRQSHLRRSSDSVTTVSGLASTDSLPEC